MQGKRVYTYSKKSRWRDLKQITLYVMVPFFILNLLILIWCNFYTGQSWVNFFPSLIPISIVFAIALTLGLILRMILREALKIELDEDGISTSGWGQRKMTIPFSEINEIVESKFGAVSIRSKHLNRLITLSPPDFEPNDYAEIKASLEQWKKYTAPTENELKMPLIALGCLALYGILIPVFSSSPIPIIKAAPFLVMFVVMIVSIILMRRRQEAPTPKLTQYAPYFFVLLAALLAMMTFFSVS